MSSMIMLLPMKYLLISLAVVGLLLGAYYLSFDIDRREQKLDIDMPLMNIDGDKLLLDKLIVNVFFEDANNKTLRTILFKGTKYKDHLPSDRREFMINYDNILFDRFGVDSFERVLGYEKDLISLTFVSVNNDTVYYCINTQTINVISSESCSNSAEKRKLNPTPPSDGAANDYTLHNPITDGELETYRCQQSFLCKIRKIINH